MVILNISAFLLMNFSAHTKVPDRYERWWVTRVTPCPPMGSNTPFSGHICTVLTSHRPRKSKNAVSPCLS